jgi:hypothetical protein
MVSNLSNYLFLVFSAAADVRHFRHYFFTPPLSDRRCMIRFFFKSDVPTYLPTYLPAFFFFFFEICSETCAMAGRSAAADHAAVADRSTVVAAPP